MLMEGARGQEQAGGGEGGEALIRKNLKQRKICPDEEIINVEEKDDSLYCQQKRKMVQELENNIKLRKVHEDENENNDSDDTLIEECHWVCDCPNAPSLTITCPLHFILVDQEMIEVNF